MTMATVGSGDRVERTTRPGTARTQRPEAATKPSVSSSRKSSGSLNSRVIAIPPARPVSDRSLSGAERGLRDVGGLVLAYLGLLVRPLVLADRRALLRRRRPRVEPVVQP